MLAKGSSSRFHQSRELEGSELSVSYHGEGELGVPPPVWEEVGGVAGVFVIHIRAKRSRSLYFVTGSIVLSL